MLEPQRVDRKTRLIQHLRYEVRRGLPPRHLVANSLSALATAPHRMIFRPRGRGGFGRLYSVAVVVAMRHRPAQVAAQAHIPARAIRTQGERGIAKALGYADLRPCKGND
jgi:hypothetical protein